VLIAWATPAEVPDFGVDIVGEAGPDRVTSGDLGQTAYVSGMVTLDPVKLERIHGHDGEQLVRGIIMHELGHLVGLAHTEHDDQLMFPRANAAVTTFGVGDRTGLARLGQGPCQPDL
jgi:predicted Zn-dependent protease